MSKVLIGVGVGCGGLVLVAIIAIVGGLYWAKGKVETFADAAGATGANLEESQQRMEGLNKKHAFELPPKGQPVKLEEGRLREYLAVRATLTPVFQKYEAQSKKFEGRDQEKAGFGDALEAMSIVANLLGDLHRTWLDGLEAKKMSPNEFGAITAAVYGSPMAEGMGQMHASNRQMLTQLREQTRKMSEDPSLSEDVQEAAREQLAELDEQLAALPDETKANPTARKLHRENAALLKQMEAEVQKDAMPGIDILLGSLGSEGFQQAFDSYGEE